MNIVELANFMGSELGEEVKDSLYEIPSSVWNFLLETENEVDAQQIVKNLNDLSISTNLRHIERSLNRYVYAGVMEKKIRYGGPKVLITGYKIRSEYADDLAAPILCKRANIKEIFVYFRFRNLLLKT